MKNQPISRPEFSRRKQKALFQGWLEATKIEGKKGVAYKITPEALQKCLRVHLDQL
jgi:hypothetical protein